MRTAQNKWNHNRKKMVYQSLLWGTRKDFVNSQDEDTFLFVRLFILQSTYADFICLAADTCQTLKYRQC